MSTNGILAAAIKPSNKLLATTPKKIRPFNHKNMTDKAFKHWLRSLMLAPPFNKGTIKSDSRISVPATVRG